MNLLLRSNAAFGMMFLLLGFAVRADAAEPLFKVIGFYSDTVEAAHRDYAHAAIGFYKKLAVQKNFQFDSTKDWKNNCNYAFMSQYDVVLWLNLFCYTTVQQADFQKYMENGGAWMGFHASGYYDNSMNWPWEQTFMHQGNYCKNNWPPATCKLVTDDQTHPSTLHLAKKWTGPVNEYYQFCPSPRLNADIRVLISIDPAFLPFGTGSDVIPAGADVPIVWTNKKFDRMIYSNIGHGAAAIGSDTNMTHLLTDAIMWLGTPTTKIRSPEMSARNVPASLKMKVQRIGQIVSLSISGENRIDAMLLDEKGRMISNARSNNGICRFDRTKVAGGIYFIHIICQKGHITQRLFLDRQH
jgi:uncharacterized protein